MRRKLNIRNRVQTLCYSNHCLKSVRIWSFSGPYSVWMWENKDQKNSKYGYFSRSECHDFLWYPSTSYSSSCIFISLFSLFFKHFSSHVFLSQHYIFLLLNASVWADIPRKTTSLTGTFAKVSGKRNLQHFMCFK